MMFPLVQDLAAEGFSVRLTCGTLGFSPQAFYKWQARPCSDRDLNDAWLTNALVDLHGDDPEFGYRFLTDELTDAGAEVGERRVWRLCRDQRLWSTTTKKGRTGKGRPGPAVHDDLVQRNFTAEGPDRVWLTDITEHPTGEGKLYCCAIKDVFSNRIVGYSIDSRMKARLVVAAIEMAVARRGGDVAGCILHSDRGSQFRARKVHRVLAHHGMVGSMGQVGSAGDNAAMESFVALLQKNVHDRRHRWETRDELRIEIVTWIERTYHRRRRQAALGRLTPIEYEMTMTPPAATAA
jgi:putative transposase